MISDLECVLQDGLQLDRQILVLGNGEVFELLFKPSIDHVHLLLAATPVTLAQYLPDKHRQARVMHTTKPR